MMRQWCQCLLISLFFMIGSSCVFSAEHRLQDARPSPAQVGLFPDVYMQQIFRFSDEKSKQFFIKSEDDITQQVRKFKRRSFYLQRIYGKFLLEQFTADKKGEMDKKYNWVPKTNDLRRTSGRAAWAIKEIFDISLPWITPKTSADEVKRIGQLAQARLDAYWRGAIAARQVSKKKLAQLRKQYKGKILFKIRGEKDKDYEEIYKSMMAFHALLIEWFPIGKPIRDLESVVGKKGTNDETFVADDDNNGDDDDDDGGDDDDDDDDDMEDRYLEYTFYRGDDSVTTFRFYLDGEVIRSVIVYNAG